MSERKRSLISRSFAVLPCLLLSFLSLTPALSGAPFFGGGVQAMTASLRAVAEEPTPNYGGLGFFLQAGYGLGSWLDLSVDLDYNQLDEGMISILDGDARLFAAGLSLTSQLGETALVAISYQHSQLTWPMLIDGEGGLRRLELGGGLLGIRLGGQIEISYDWILQISLQYRSGQLRQRKSAELMPWEVERTVDTFALAVTYLFKESSRHLYWRYF